MKYNPSDVGKKGNLFGLPYSLSDSDLILLPVNLDVTVSYGEGTSRSPELILDESSQLDLSLPRIEKPWELKVTMAEQVISSTENDNNRAKAKTLIEELESGAQISQDLLEEVNRFCKEIHTNVEERCKELLEQNKIVAVVGGDHSSPLGLIKALSDRKDFSILQIDAHMDLRDSYEGFTYSHASIMHNALQCSGVKSLTQVGIRDYCEEEEKYAANSIKPIHTFKDEILFEKKMEGIDWQKQVKLIIETLSGNVYISFDIDGLDPSLCTQTGTPVPGGLTFNEAIYLLNELVASGKKIIGFDLCEVGSASWDANVGARVLYRLATALGVSQRLISLT